MSKKRVLLSVAGACAVLFSVSLLQNANAGTATCAKAPNGEVKCTPEMAKKMKECSISKAEVIAACKAEFAKNGKTTCSPEKLAAITGCKSAASKASCPSPKLSQCSAPAKEKSTCPMKK